jgi:hypothetical protein
MSIVIHATSVGVKALLSSLFHEMLHVCSSGEPSHQKSRLALHDCQVKSMALTCLLTSHAAVGSGSTAQQGTQSVEE